MVPTIIRTQNLRIVIYPKDHNPPHVHIYGPANIEAKFYLDKCECFFSRGFSKKSLNQIRKFLLENIDLLIEAWDEYQK